jgi:maltodextrin utilization protein YvdJ
MIRKSILLEFGGYDDLFPTCEDYALWLLVSKKYKVHNIPKILCKLRLHKESISIKKFEEQTFSQILAVRMVTNQLTDTDKEGIQQFGVKYLKDTLSNDEMNYYLIRAANAYRINNNFYEARKVYRKLFLMNHFDLIAILNYFRLFFGKKFVNETTKIYKIFRNKCMSELDQHQKI